MSQLLLLGPSALSASLAQPLHAPASGPLARGLMADPPLVPPTPAAARMSRSHSPPSSPSMSALPKRAVAGVALWSPQPSRASAASPTGTQRVTSQFSRPVFGLNLPTGPNAISIPKSASATPTPTGTRPPVSPLALTRLHLQARVEPSPSSSTPSPNAENALLALASPKGTHTLLEAVCTPSECSGYLSLVQSSSASLEVRSGDAANGIAAEHKQHSLCLSDANAHNRPHAVAHARSEQHSSQRYVLTRAEELSDRDSVHMPEVEEAVITKKKAGQQETAPSLASSQPTTRSKRTSSNVQYMQRNTLQYRTNTRCYRVHRLINTNTCKLLLLTSRCAKWQTCSRGGVRSGRRRSRRSRSRNRSRRAPGSRCSVDSCSASSAERSRPRRSSSRAAPNAAEISRPTAARAGESVLQYSTTRIHL